MIIIEARYCEKENSWIIDKTINGKRKVVRFSANIYGDYAKELTEMSFRDNKRYKNYIVIENDYAVIKAYSQKLGYRDIYIDIEDIEKIQICKWGIDEDLRDGVTRTVARNHNKGLLHRHILGLTSDDNCVVDHIDRNALNNRKSNLRVVDNRENQKNKNLQKNNTSGIAGVRFNDREKVWIARIADNDGKRRSKAFSINKYGDEDAKQMAITWRKSKEQEYGYLT